MKKLGLLLLLSVLSGTLDAQNLRIVNAASLSSVSLSPGSIFTVLGNNLTNTTVTTSNAQTPPTSLGGTTVTIGGAAASLFYVSPTQINGVVNPSAPPGAQTVVVTSPTGTQTGSVTIALIAPPGLFSLLGTGSRDGAVLNAVTFLQGDFSVKTANSPTYLALFATGLNLSVAPTVTIAGVPVSVVFFGTTSCCMGLEQINVMLPDSLAGAGRVPVVVTSTGQSSNTVQIVLLPPSTAKQFDDDEDNQTRSRELASVAYVPGTSTVLITDTNDDVVRVVDVMARKVTHVIALPDGAQPIGIAANMAGTRAIVAESGLGKVAILDLTKLSVAGEVATGAGPTTVAVSGSQGIVVNQDSDSVSIVDLTTATLQKTIAVGHGPVGLAVDPNSATAFIVNENDGTVSVINMPSVTVTQTIPLGADTRAEGIALVTGTGLAFITVPADSPNGTVLLVNVATGATVATIKANPDSTGGSGDVVYFNSKIYFANQSGGSISVLPVNPTTGMPTGPATTIKVDLGARALAIDTNDNLLVVSNEGSGTLVLIDLKTNEVVGRIRAVRSDDDDNEDDHSDHNAASNLPAIQKITPASGKAGTTVNLTITGARFNGVSAVTFEAPGNGNDNGNGNGNGKGKGKGKKSQADTDFTVSNLHVSADGTQITLTVAIKNSAKPGARVVRVNTPNGTSSEKSEDRMMFVVTP